MPYFKDFEIRWSDLDANLHLGNSAYTNLMTHARMSYLSELGFDHKTLIKHRLGPVVFYEHMYYFKEVLPGSTVKVSVEVKGLSEDGMFFEFHQNFYNDQGKNVARCEMMGSWMSWETRKLVALQGELLAGMRNVEKAPGFRVLTKEDTRIFRKLPIDLG
jgi:acyl-CoA thioester hydrolase